MLHCNTAATLATILLLATLTGCDAGTPLCRSGSECPSGICRTDGTCAPLRDEADGRPEETAPPEDDAIQPDATDPPDVAGPEATPIEPDAAGEPDLTTPDTAPGPDVALPTCKPNHDGTLTRAEVPMGAGLEATFRVALGVTVATAGEEQPDGTRVWDLAHDLSGDEDVLTVTRPLDGEWFAEDFPGATYFSRLSQRDTTLGVFEVTGEALLLLGLVSPDPGFLSTKVTYNPPVEVLRFPITAGSTWETKSTATGFVDGIAILVTEHYVSTADGSGILQTPFGNFPVRRIRVTLSRQAGFVTTTVRQHVFVTECFGTVATVISEDEETQADFTQAAEVRRITP